MMEKLLLSLQYESKLKGIELPWDDAVHRINPGSSGPSALQHLNKCRGYLAVEGHFIPPPLNSLCEPTIRGFVRDMNFPVQNGVATTMAVCWDDEFEHPKVNLEVPGVVVGSGRYQRKPGHGMTVSARRAHKNEPPKAKYDPKYLKWLEDVKMGRNKESGKQRDKRYKAKITSPPKSKRARVKHEEPEDADESEADPADLESDEDYSPEVSKKPAPRALRKMPRKSAKKAALIPASPSTGSEITSDEDEDEAPRSRLVKLPVSSIKLRHLAEGRRIVPSTASTTIPDHFASSDETGSSYESSSSLGDDDHEDEGYAEPAASVGKMGSTMHGSLAEYSKAHAAERAPGVMGIDEHDEDVFDMSPQAIDNIVSTVFEDRAVLRDALQAGSSSIDDPFVDTRQSRGSGPSSAPLSSSWIHNDQQLLHSPFDATSPGMDGMMHDFLAAPRLQQTPTHHAGVRQQQYAPYQSHSHTSGVQYQPNHEAVQQQQSSGYAQVSSFQNQAHHAAQLGNGRNALLGNNTGFAHSFGQSHQHALPDEEYEGLGHNRFAAMYQLPDGYDYLDDEV